MATKTKLYFSWKALRRNNKGNVSPLWDIYTDFAKDVGEKLEGYFLAKKNRDEPWGPNNFYWKKVLTSGFDHSDPEQAKEYNRQYRELRPNYDREIRYKRKYGITLAEYEVMADLQKNLCYTCDKHETQSQQGVVRQLAVDHCHKTGRVRKLLCNNCNAVIGHAKESIETLERIIAYLKEFQVA